MKISYPKGLELPSSEEGEEEEEVEAEEINPQVNDSRLQSTINSDSNTNTSPARHRIIQRIARSTSGTSTPSSSSSSERTSISTSTSATTPSSSTTSFTPIGIAPSASTRHTSQLPTSRDLSTYSTPLFVTWNILSPTAHPHQNSPTLRGCIGTFSSSPIISSLPEYALTSALHDTRFPPISYSELPTLEVAVTLLTDFETCAHALDWELGIHGIRITFYYKNKRYGACYLPDVAVEQEWTREETVVSAMRKAGWGGRREKWREVGQLTVVRYQGRKESVSWREFNDWRGWVENFEAREREGDGKLEG
ncbi:hypothetical protein NHQ30_008351 [Ciborinia camelliae]|nr:hypothetical protein NHQ30_008351 [Ciborinia camelliae]